MRPTPALPASVIALRPDRRRMLAGLAGGLGAALAAGVAPGLAQAQARPLRAVATVAMVADTVREVGGPLVTVETLLGEGVDPHTYRPTRADMAKLLSADIVFANGFNLEAQLREPLQQVARTRPVVRVVEAVPEAERLADPDYPGQFDPHVWMDPRLWRHAVGAVAAGLAERAPAGRDVFSAAGRLTADALTRLDGYIRGVTATVPAERRVIVTAHDAFGYFGRAYGFEVEGVQGLSTESEAGLKRIEDLVSLIVTRKLPAIFVEASVADRNVRALVEGAAARGHQVTIGGSLYSDSMGAPGTYEGTLVGMLDHNATVVAKALGGTVPARGMAGRLAL